MGVALDGIKPKHTGALGVVFGNYGAWASFRMIRVAAYARRVSFTLPEQVTRIAVCGISAKQRRDAIAHVPAPARFPACSNSLNISKRGDILVIVGVFLRFRIADQTQVISGNAVKGS